MTDFMQPDILKQKEIKMPNFLNNTEAVQFVLKVMDEDKDNLQKIIKSVMEASYRDLARTTCFLNFLCQDLDVDYAGIHEEVEKFLDNNWDNIKHKAQDRVDIEKRVNDIFKDQNK